MSFHKFNEKKLFVPFQKHHIFHVLCVREHIHRLNLEDCEVAAEDFQIPCLAGRVAAHLNNLLWRSVQNNLGHRRMDTGSRRIQDYNIRSSVLFDEVVAENIFHVSGKEFGV